MNFEYKKASIGKESIILGVIVAVGALFLSWVVYTSIVGKNKVDTCGKNLRTIADAVEKYGKENNKFPETFDSKLKCINAKNYPISYGLNADLKGKRWDQLRDDDIIAAESDQFFFLSLSDLAFRHKDTKNNRYAQAITKDKKIVAYQAKDKNVPGQDVPVNNPNECLSKNNLCKKRCNSTKTDDPYFSQCPADCWDQYNRCLNNKE